MEFLGANTLVLGEDDCLILNGSPLRDVKNYSIKKSSADEATELTVTIYVETIDQSDLLERH